MMFSRPSYLLLTLIIIFQSSPVSSESPPTCDATATSECQNRLLSEAEKFTVAYRQCLLHQLKNSEIKIWNVLSSVIRSCLAREKFSEAINVTMIGKRIPYDLDVSKFIILPSPIDSPCVAVIARLDKLGEGPVEQELIRLMPQCERHVASRDPNAKISNGKIYNKAISVREIGDPYWNEYADNYGLPREHPDVDPREVTLKNFLEKHVKAPIIDFLWIDQVILHALFNERIEKPFIPFASSFHGYTIFLFGLKDVTVCQITLITSIYFHHDGVDLNEELQSRFSEIFPFTLASPILPIHSDFSKKTGFLRTSYMNMASPYCLKKYLAPVYCGKEACWVDQKLEESKKIENEWKEFQENLKKLENDLDKIEVEFEDIMEK